VLFRTVEVQDILAFAELVAAPADEVADMTLLRVINVPKRGVSSMLFPFSLHES
jgi:hypothetical protein